VSSDAARYDTLLLIYFEQFPQVANSPPPWGKVAVLPAYSLKLWSPKSNRVIVILKKTLKVAASVYAQSKCVQK